MPEIEPEPNHEAVDAVYGTTIYVEDAFGTAHREGKRAISAVPHAWRNSGHTR